MELVKLAKCSNSDTKKITSILESNCIEFFISKKVSLKVEIKVKRKDFVYANLLTEKFLLQQELSLFEPIQNIEKLRKMHHLINTQTTETPTLFANKLGLSHRQLNLFLKHLKNLNAKIGYDNEKNSYYYKNAFSLLFQFSLLSITDKDVVEIICTSEDELDMQFKKKTDFLF